MTETNHLQMAEDALLDTRHGEGLAIGLALVALVKRIDQGLELAERIWWSALTTEQRAAELSADAELERRNQNDRVVAD